MSRGNIVLSAVDIGTARIRVAIGETNDKDDNINLIGFSERSSDSGVIKGEISDVNKVTSILNDVCREAEKKAKTPINSDALYVGITGSHIASRDSSGTVLISSSDKKVTYHHLEEALNNARSLQLPPDSVIINSVDGYSFLDGTHKEIEPVGHIASKLEAHTHIIYGSKNKVENFQSIVKEQGFESATPVFSSLATSLVVSTSDDFIHGVITLCIGAGISQYIVFNDYVVKDVGVVTLGCDHIANDLALGLDIHINKARDILTQNLHIKRVSDGFNTIEFKSSFGIRKIPIASVEKIIDLRIREIFEIIAERIKAKKLNKLSRNGLILCGGISLMNYAPVIARSVFEMPARVGLPLDFSGPDDVIKNPANLTVLGILRYSKEDIKVRAASGDSNLVHKLDHRLSALLRKTFLRAFRK